MKPWQEAVEAAGSKLLGSTDVHLEAETCRFEECNFGNFLTDAMVFAVSWVAVNIEANV